MDRPIEPIRFGQPTLAAAIPAGRELHVREARAIHNHERDPIFVPQVVGTGVVVSPRADPNVDGSSAMCLAARHDRSCSPKAIILLRQRRSFGPLRCAVVAQGATGPQSVISPNCSSTCNDPREQRCHSHGHHENRSQNIQIEVKAT